MGVVAAAVLGGLAVNAAVMARFSPRTQSPGLKSLPPQKKVHVVGHDDLASYRNALFSISAFCVSSQCLMRRAAGEHTLAAKCAERHEINRLAVGLKYRGQSRRLA